MFLSKANNLHNIVWFQITNDNNTNKNFYLTPKWDFNKYQYSESEWNWE